MKKNLFSIGKKQVRVPIVQGGMGVGISLGRLAGTVAKEGGAGTISAAQIGFKEPDFYENPIEANKRAIHKEMQKARAISPDGIVGFNLMVAMNDYETYAHEVIAAGADFIVSGAGLPVDLPAYTADSDIAIAPIVSTQKSARVILKFWDKKYKRTADFIVIEGPMAGGHLGFHKEQLEEFTPDIYGEEVKKIITVVQKYEEKYEKKIPVILAGGIYDQCRQRKEKLIDGSRVFFSYKVQQYKPHHSYAEPYGVLSAVAQKNYQLDRCGHGKEVKGLTVPQLFSENYPADNRSDDRTYENIYPRHFAVACVHIAKIRVGEEVPCQHIYCRKSGIFPHNSRPAAT